ncbi:MAG: transposase, partial [Gammaproteobacteria bacterium]
DAFRACCERYQDAEHEKTRQLAREFLNDWEAIFAVLSHPQLPLTNNQAEVRFVGPKPKRRMLWGMGPEPKNGDVPWFENLILV